ncbi:Esterase [Streptococcus pneumoniae]|nr:Esterase [Streptococcus pneumoniae]
MNQSYFYLKMKEHKLKVPYTGKERRVRILLPKDYEKDTDRSYPVVYFHPKSFIPLSTRCNLQNP